jgi:urease accessory protein UreF
MPQLRTCLDLLRRLIAAGDMKGMSLAERAINEYWDGTLERARSSGLRLVQLDVLDQRNVVVGAQHDFAQAVNEYIEKKLRDE